MNKHPTKLKLGDIRRVWDHPPHLLQCVEVEVDVEQAARDFSTELVDTLRDGLPDIVRVTLQEVVERLLPGGHIPNASYVVSVCGRCGADRILVVPKGSLGEDWIDNARALCVHCAAAYVVMERLGIIESDNLPPPPWD